MALDQNIALLKKWMTMDKNAREMDKKMSRWGVVFSAPPGMNEHTPVNDSIRSSGDSRE